MSERTRSRFFLGASALFVAVALTACGGSAGDTGEPSASDTAPDDAFAECMRDNGVDIPEGQFQAGVGVAPGQAPDGTMLTEPPDEVTRIDGEAFEAARDACEDLLPEGAVMFGGPGGPGGAGIDESAFRAYRSCMADHGVERPDPGPADPGDGVPAPPVTVVGDDPDFAAAQAICAALLPEVTESAPPTTAA